MRIDLLGVRGSTPCPGRDFEKVGGHTSSVAISANDSAPSLLLDAGTGLRSLDRLLHGEPFRGALLLGHLHWDHTQGLPFCSSIDRDDAQVRLLLPRQGHEPGALLARAMSPPHFPVTPHQLRGTWSFEDMEPGWHDIEQFRVLAREVPHKGGRTFGFRVEDGVSAFAYISDHAPQLLGPGPDGWGAYHRSALELCEDVDLLIHDAQYLTSELPTLGAFGHASADYGAGLGAVAGARRVLLFHHDPGRTDDEVEAICRDVAARHETVELGVAREGMSIDLGQAGPPEGSPRGCHPPLQSTGFRP